MITSLLALTTTLPLSAAHHSRVPGNAILDRFRSTSLDQQKFAGLFAQRMRANSEGFLEHIQEKTFFASGAVLRSDTGTFLEAEVTSYEYNHDPQLKSAIDRLAANLLASASTYASNSGADAWPPAQLWKFRSDVLGLGAYFYLTHDPNALDSMRKLGSAGLNAFANADRDKRWPTQALIEPLACLYRYTRDDRYLSLARTLARSMRQAGTAPSLAPTYENLAGLEGLVELYGLIGDPTYIRTASGAWAALHDRGISITGAPLVNGQPAGACETLAWMQLTLGLLRISGDATYADSLERTIYNQLFAGQDTTAGAIFATPPSAGRKLMADPADPCLASQALGIALVPFGVWGRYGSGIQVNLYGAGRNTVPLRRRGTVQLYSEASFPESGDVLLHVEPSHPLRFPLRLRVPEWASAFTVDVGGTHLLGKPGAFLTLNRQWNRGDTVRISMEMTVHLIESGSPVSGEVAVQRGPQILALGSKYNPEVSDFAAASLDVGKSPAKMELLKPTLPSTWAEDQAYPFPGKYDGKPRQLVLTPFADTTDFRVWMKRSNASSSSVEWP